jgi:hypothetical protein
MDLFGRNYMIRGFLLSLPLWGLSLLAGTSQATVYDIPTDGSSVVGTDNHMAAVYKDTLLEIARRNSLGDRRDPRHPEGKASELVSPRGRSERASRERRSAPGGR